MPREGGRRDRDIGKSRHRKIGKSGEVARSRDWKIGRSRQQGSGKIGGKEPENGEIGTLLEIETAEIESLSALPG